MLRFEAALAQAVAEAGLIPKRMAPIIVKACDPALYDPAQLVEAARRTATLTVPVVKALTDEVAKRDAEAAGYVHWGATSQDVIDTAMVLQLGEALPPLLKELDAIVGAFASLARKHRRTPMLGRTLLQPATPLALGQKIAGWASDIDRAARRLEASFKETQVVQFGGASGSLSALGEKAEPVMTSLAKRLRLELPAAPWFTQRVRVAALGAGRRAGRRRAGQGRARHLADDAGRGRRGGRALRPRPRRLLDHAAQAQSRRRRARPVGGSAARRCWPPPSSPPCRRSTSARWAAGRPNGRPSPP